MGTDAPRRSVDGRRGRIEPDAPGVPIAGGVDIRYGRRRPRRDIWNVREVTTPTEKASMHRSRYCRGERGSRGGLGGIPSPYTVTRHRSRGRHAAREQEAVGLMSSSTRRGRTQATARQLHRGALRSNAGPNRLRRKTADRPAKLIRTPARAADAAPGAVDPSRCTQTT